MEVSKVEVVVLGLLAEERLYGYELLERLRDRSLAFWVEVGRASVYQALRRLEQEGLITGKAQGGPTARTAASSGSRGRAAIVSARDSRSGSELPLRTTPTRTSRSGSLR
ncbi:MAG: PadR family transcriptional regulator [Actinomycetota bacterium]|nr:PadR family transcriptional regulator [Actinomycetota bacterium]